MTKLLLKIIVLATACCLSFLKISQAEYKPLHKETRLLMGTFVEVISPYKEAINLAFTEMEKLDKLLSKYNPDSEISQLNKNGSMKVSKDTFDIMKKSKFFWEKSSGLFDITVGPLVDLWGFTDRNFKIPSDEQIKETLKIVGSDKIILHEENSMVELAVVGMKLDLGAIAKGYAVDAAAQKLKENSIDSALINAGGNIYCIGDNNGKPWNIAVKNPFEANEYAGEIQIKDRAVATSGDYEQFFIMGGNNYTHIINPKTGYPVKSNLSSVTVTASDATTADALSTILFIVGKEGSKAILDQFPQTKAQFIER